MTKGSKIDFLLKMPRFAVMLGILLYQKTLSPDHGLLKDAFPNGFCRYWPSCSAYGYQAVHKHGVLVGLYLAIVRVLRCNPWSHGGIDEVK